LWLAGENKSGIKSADKLLKTHFGSVRKLDNARHCVLYEASKPLDKNTFDPLTYRRKWPLECNPDPIMVTSYPGVFAHGRLDTGTALLLDALDDIHIEGEVLDFACGAGLIGSRIAANHKHAHVSLLDNSALALKACQETLADNHLDGSLIASDGLSELGGKFDLVVSNPPIHTGVKTDSHLSIGLLESVHEHINPGGSLIMVANIHLPSENWLSRSFRHRRQLTATDHYKVILAAM
jgi:16S rRNA (guanine1207-N2)-methyltransferase